MWSTEGVFKDEAASTATETVCVALHTTAFGVDIDFTLEAPKVSLKNFDPTNSYVIYSVFGYDVTSIVTSLTYWLQIILLCHLFGLYVLSL